VTETRIEFPADIAVKAMGLNTSDFKDCVSALALPHIESSDVSITTLPSKEGKYLSVSVRFTATSLEQLQAVYSALQAEPRILYTL